MILPTQFMVTESLKLQAYAKLLLLSQTQSEWELCVGHLRNSVDSIEQIQREWVDGSFALAVGSDAVDPVPPSSVDPTTREKSDA